jgi:glycogen operon protein
MTDEAWNADFARSLGMLLSGSAIEEVDERGEPVLGDTLLGC